MTEISATDLTESLQEFAVGDWVLTWWVWPGRASCRRAGRRAPQRSHAWGQVRHCAGSQDTGRRRRGRGAPRQAGQDPWSLHVVRLRGAHLGPLLGDSVAALKRKSVLRSPAKARSERRLARNHGTPSTARRRRSVELWLATCYTAVKHSFGILSRLSAELLNLPA